MSDLTILSDAELDAVVGGILNAGRGGNGGAGGQVANGAALQFSGGWNEIERVNLSTNHNTGTANGGTGGAGGAINLTLHFGGMGGMG
ncbi:MAG TPA: hypothetical protein PLD10_01010 [Rhodopila sp.]|nr:hypothetical protein [Rhodopila sp.]